jgi:hypothetical protein
MPSQAQGSAMGLASLPLELHTLKIIIDIILTRNHETLQLLTKFPAQQFAKMFDNCRCYFQ